MPSFTQDNRQLAVTTPLGKDALLLEEFSGSEGISRPFQYTLDMLAQPNTTVDFGRLLGQSVTVKLEIDTGGFRYFNGIVHQLTECEQESAAETGAVFTRYRAEVVPKAWLLSKVTRSRIFQQKSVPDILKAVFTGLDAAWEIQGTFEPRNFCVQYRESDLNFAHRLMEEEGIFYFFRHADGLHKMVVTNSNQSCQNVPEKETVVFRRRGEKTPFGSEEFNHRVTAWEKTQEIRSSEATLWDHNFELPDKNLEAVQPITPTAQAGTVSHKLALDTTLKQYDYPGDYAQRFDGIAPGGGDQASKLQKVFQDNIRTVKLRMEAETTPGLLAQGDSNCRQFTPGYKFKLADHFNANGEYVLTEVKHAATQAGIFTTNVTAQLQYANQFVCLPSGVVYRPQRLAPRPRVAGTQTALVVGPAGQEIFTDKYGRVKVQFFWDREGKKDADSSCWVRVATSWAGKNWGMIHIPRIGQEVIVDFLEGDPDKPLIVGSVYNAEQMPPYLLPDHMTKSGLKSRSTTKGTEENFNELRFEDLKGKEEIYFHAEKDFNRVVENNDTLVVGSDKAADGSQTIKIYKNRTETVETGDETVTVAKGKRTVTISEGNELLQVAKGTRTVVVDKGDDTHQIKGGNRTVTVDKGNDALTIAMGDQNVKLSQGATTTEAMKSILLKVGSSSIKIEPAGITIQAVKVVVNGDASVKIGTLMADINGSAALTLKGGVVKIN